MKRKPTKKPTRRPARCINPDCPSKGVEYARGLCEPCYRCITRLIKLQRIKDWKEAESRAMCRGRKPIGVTRFPTQVAAAEKASKK